MTDVVKLISDSLDGGKLYAIRARAMDQFGRFSNWSETYTLRTSTKVTPSGAPLNVRATAGVRTIILQWDPVSDKDFKAYEIHVHTGNAEFNPTTDTMVGRIGQSNIEIISKFWNGAQWQDLVPGSAYSIKMRAVNADGYVSGYTPFVSVTTGYATNGDIQAGTIVGDRIVAGTITTGNMDALIFVSGKYVRSGNFDGTFDSNGNIVNTGTAGWALDWSGRIVASQGILRSKVSSGINNKIVTIQQNANGNGLVGFDSPALDSWFIPTLQTDLTNISILDPDTNTTISTQRERLGVVGPSIQSTFQRSIIQMLGSPVDSATNISFYTYVDYLNVAKGAQYIDILYNGIQSNINSQLSSSYFAIYDKFVDGATRLRMQFTNNYGQEISPNNNLMSLNNSGFGSFFDLRQRTAAQSFGSNQYCLIYPETDTSANIEFRNVIATKPTAGGNYLSFYSNIASNYDYFQMVSFPNTTDQTTRAQFIGRADPGVEHSLRMWTRMPNYDTFQSLQLTGVEPVFRHFTYTLTNGQSDGHHPTFIGPTAGTQYFIQAGFAPLLQLSDGIGNAVLIFPVAFPNATLSVQLSLFGSTHLSYGVSVVPGSMTAQSCKVRFADFTTGPPAINGFAANLCWMAIGY